MVAPVPPNEAARLQALYSFDILDSEAEQAYDDITRLAARLCNTPITVVSLIDGHRQWFKSKVGLDASETPLDVAFCTHTILEHETVIVPDATKDPRFCDNPLVTGAPDIRFYAGAQLTTPDGFNLGTLCVVDMIPREFTPEQKADLEALARQVMAQFVLRRQVAELKAASAARQAADEAIRESEGRYRDLFDSMQELVQSVDVNGKLIYANRSWREKLGYTQEEAAALNLSQIVHPDEQPRAKQMFQRAITGEKFRNVDGKLITKTGATLSVEVDFHFIFKDGQPFASRTIFRDVTEKKNLENLMTEYQRELEAANTRLRALATTDGLTGINNRALFQNRFAEEFERAVRYGRALSLLIMDVDHFKKFNDSFGHPAGDEVLKSVAKLLAATCRGTDILARYGGEEFVVLLPDTDQGGAMVLAERFRRAVAGGDWPQRPVTLSIGAASVTQEMWDPNQLLQKADAALYRSKESGRNRVTHGGASVSATKGLVQAG
ncbi:sensor domain-containing diguanylate cyclase [Zavarzinella formosa]|uniref:sensor domain-containing diguanylate cyclase n=1 Tax=Zavarzinella formosa TaxID=360055 RepID=UPI0002ECDC1A|nr:diguanylate cyclase [Zavarzinella formosa]